jgi:hypothetical protein
MVDQLDTLEFLQGIYGTETYKQILAKQQYNFQVFRKLSYAYRAVLDSACVSHLERHFLGYYFVDGDRREIWGFKPINLFEFCLFCMNIAYILLYKPSVSIAFWYAEKTFRAYDLDLNALEEIKESLITAYESRKTT